MVGVDVWSQKRRRKLSSLRRLARLACSVASFQTTRYCQQRDHELGNMELARKVVAFNKK